MRVGDAKNLCPDVIVRESDPELIRDVSAKFMRICRDYSPDVTPKSIDELVMNFSGMEGYLKKSLVEVGREIKARFRTEVGDWISCNVGISTNRFLAKLASSLHKPDGLDVIDNNNLIDVYSSVKLTDLHGINIRYQARLNAVGIFTPLQFLQAGDNFLRKQVFQSIAGHYWHMRLRGWEVDDFESGRKSFGQEYSLGKKTDRPEQLAALIMMLVEKMGRRLRSVNMTASGVHLGLMYKDWSLWHRGRKFNETLYTTQELFRKAMILFGERPQGGVVSKISVSCFDLNPNQNETLRLFEDDVEKKRRVSLAVDSINDRWGEYVITTALMMESKKTIIDRIAFGGLKSKDFSH